MRISSAAPALASKSSAANNTNKASLQFMLHFRGIVLVHLALYARLGTGFFKHLSHDWVIVFIFDLIAAELHIYVGFSRILPIDPVILSAAPAKRQIARRDIAGVEMLVKPVGRRHDHASRLPIITLDRLPLRVHERISLAAKNDYVRAGTVKMGLLVRAHGKLRDMGAHRILGNLEAHLRAAGAAFFPLKQLKIFHVRDKVSFPYSSGVPVSLPPKVAFLIIVPISEDVIAVKDEVHIVQQVDHEGRARDCEVTRRLIAAAVKMPIPAIEGWRKKRSLLPFERALWPALMPDRRGPMTTHDVDQLLKEMPLGFKTLARRNLADIGVVGLAGTFQTDTGSQATLAGPWVKRHRCKIFDEESLYQRDTFGFDPLAV